MVVPIFHFWNKHIVVPWLVGWLEPWLVKSLLSYAGGDDGTLVGELVVCGTPLWHASCRAIGLYGKLDLIKCTESTLFPGSKTWYPVRHTLPAPVLYRYQRGLPRQKPATDRIDEQALELQCCWSPRQPLL